MVEIHAFAYRTPRLSLEHSIEFCVAGTPIPGWTRDVSETGLLVRFPEPVLPGTKGSVRWRFGGCTVEIEASVVHSEFIEAGLEFSFASEAERQFVHTLVKLLIKGSKLRGSALKGSGRS